MPAQNRGFNPVIRTVASGLYLSFSDPANQPDRHNRNWIKNKNGLQ